MGLPCKSGIHKTTQMLLFLIAISMKIFCKIPIMRSVSIGVRSDSFTNIDIVSPSLQRQIIEGKDVNLASLLIPNYECPKSHTAIADNIEVNLPGKPDIRLNRALSIQEFIKAFGKFKRIMSAAYPDRRTELDVYGEDIIDISNFYGQVFYDYHKMFSAKSATLLREHHVKVDDAIKIISNYGKGTKLCKFDIQIQNAFTICPVLPSQWPLFCFKWEAYYYVYVRLSFGCRSSPKIFDNLSSAVCFIAEHNYNVRHILHLLDDFRTIDPPNFDAEKRWL